MGSRRSCMIPFTELASPECLPAGDWVCFQPLGLLRIFYACGNFLPSEGVKVLQKKLAQSKSAQGSLVLGTVSHTQIIWCRLLVTFVNLSGVLSTATNNQNDTMLCDFCGMWSSIKSWHKSRWSITILKTIKQIAMTTRFLSLSCMAPAFVFGIPFAPSLV